MSEQDTPRRKAIADRVARLAELGVMTASLLHELRQPLFAIQAHAEMALATGEPAARWREVLEQARHMEQLVGRYGGLVQASGEVHRVDLRVPVRAALDMMQIRARRLAVDLERDLTDDAVLVDAVSGALRQVTVNLIDNALDAVREREAPWVRVRVGVEADEALLEVWDCGSGFPDGLVDDAFEPFTTGKAAEEGTGLGLYITRLLVEEAGGAIAVENRTAEGTCVRVRLPLAA